jgi:hypothetical protein
MPNELTTPVLTVHIEIPTPDKSAVFGETTEWRLAIAVAAFLDTFQAAGGNPQLDATTWSADYVYPRWEIPRHKAARDKALRSRNHQAAS